MPPHGRERGKLKALSTGLAVWSKRAEENFGRLASISKMWCSCLRQNWHELPGRLLTSLRQALTAKNGTISPKQRYGLVGLLFASLVLSLVFWKVFVAPNAWAVVLGGERIGVVASQKDARDAVEKAKNLLISSGYQGVELGQELRLLPVRAKKEEINSPEELEASIAQRVAFRVLATEIRVGENAVALVKDEETANRVLEEIKKAYTPGEGRVEEVKFKENVSLAQRLALPEEVLAFEQAVDKLLGASELKDYTVKEGDSLWSIARSYGLTVEQLKRDNPQVQGERLDIGQVLKVRLSSPPLHVVAVYEQEVVESIPYGTEVKTNPDLARGQERVKQKGEEGQKRVVYRLVAENGQIVQRETVKTEIIKEPVVRIVERGTRSELKLASRAGGSGRLSWPVNGYISSGFGYRGREFHTGLDIATSYGTPVGAAEAGRVVFVGYDGGYGRMVMVDHGGGLVTRYAHLSGYNVTVGQEVSRGQIIGYVGTSGRTTGPHLHFEVLVNGEQRNPLNYLR